MVRETVYVSNHFEGLCNSNNNAVIAMCELCNYWFLRKNLQIVVKYAVIQDFTFCVFCLNQPSSLSL